MADKKGLLLRQVSTPESDTSSSPSPCEAPDRSLLTRTALAIKARDSLLMYRGPRKLQKGERSRLGGLSPAREGYFEDDSSPDPSPPSAKAITEKVGGASADNILASCSLQSDVCPELNACAEEDEDDPDEESESNKDPEASDVPGPLRKSDDEGLSPQEDIPCLNSDGEGASPPEDAHCLKSDGASQPEDVPCLPSKTRPKLTAKLSEFSITNRARKFSDPNRRWSFHTHQSFPGRHLENTPCTDDGSGSSKDQPSSPWRARLKNFVMGRRDSKMDEFLNVSEPAASSPDSQPSPRKRRGTDAS